ncbi:SDR family oxidoreductase [Sphingomonas gei]|uniref:SDR family oxidoreductase n=1 Tax=Sphingomonas gei TaxID=1395960 RepID=A0A4S1X4B1_9SPHN|nr:SDR family oxidoreductase [Sphingomonas gei]TGX49126.1 SDR family oxidoreductase [Sphingomonas gei]
MERIPAELESRREIVVVTGASTGIGAATARELAKRGFHVLAGVRRSTDAETLRAANLEPILLDVTNEAGIAALLKRVSEDPERRPLRGLVNNAGIGVNAPVETFPLSEWRQLFDVNLFGHVAMMQALLPALIESRGTVVNISSVGGKVAMATYGPYAGTKFALEAVSDALRREVEPLGVKVVVIEPGAVKTDMLGRVGDRGESIVSGMTTEQRGRYATLMHAIIAQAKASIPGGAPPEEAGRVIADAIVSKRPRARYTVGRNTALLIRLTRLLPDRMLDSLLARALKPYRSGAVRT